VIVNIGGTRLPVHLGTLVCVIIPLTNVLDSSVKVTDKVSAALCPALMEPATGRLLQAPCKHGPPHKHARITCFATGHDSDATHTLPVDYPASPRAMASMMATYVQRLARQRGQLGVHWFVTGCREAAVGCSCNMLRVLPADLVTVAALLC
jgi:hypothetical protein